MDLETLPAKLTEDQATVWSTWIFENSETNNVKTLTALLEENYEEVKSARSELSKLLNGHTHIVARWLADKPSSKGLALCDLLGETPESLIARYTALIPPPRATGITVDHLASLTLRIHIEDKEEPLTWTALCAFLKRKSEESDDGAPPLRLRLNPPDDDRPWRRGQVSCAMVLLNQRLTEFIENHAGFELAEEEQLFFGRGRNSLELTPEPITQEDANAWISELESVALIPSDPADRVRSFFSSVPDPTLDTFSPDHLVRAVEDVREGRLTRPDARSIHARRVEWERKTLQAGATPYAQKWLGRTRRCFARWLEIAGTLRGDLNRNELHRVLQLQTSGDVNESDILRLLEHLVHVESNEALDKYRSKILQHLPSPLVAELEKSKIIEAVGEDRYRLTTAALAFAELETPRYFEPHILESLDANANEYLVVEAVRLASVESLSRWYSVGVDIQGIDQPMVMLAIMRGLARRSDLDELNSSKALTTLWASTIWACLYGLHTTTSGSVDGYQFTFATKLSPGLRNILPRFDGEQSLHDTLREFVAPSILEAVEKWRPSLDLSSEEVDDFIFRHAPFQIPLWRVEESSPQQADLNWRHYWKRHPVLHHAEQGDREARLSLLPAIGNFRPGVRDKIPLTTLLQWRREAIDQDVSDERAIQGFAMDLRKALRFFLDERDPDLIAPLRNLMGDENLRSKLPDLICVVVNAIIDGPEAAIEWILRNRGAGNLNRWQYAIRPYVDEPDEQDTAPAIEPEDFLLTIAELLDAKDFLRGLIAIAPENLDLQIRASLFSSRPKKVSEHEHRIDPPQLIFPEVRRICRLRHQALLLLARLGDPAPLRESIKTPWEIHSPLIAQQRTHYRTLGTAISEGKSGLPDPGDEQWEELLEALTDTSLAEPFSKLDRVKLTWNERPSQFELPSYLLAIRHAPQAKRWALLKPYLARFWNRWRSQTIVKTAIFRQIVEASIPREHDFIWREASEFTKFTKEREQWALQNDGKYIRAWCKKPHNIRELAKDLEWADSIWRHLTDSQKCALLREIPSTTGFTNIAPLAEDWWQRAQMLSTKDLFYFARNHRTPVERRKIAQRWIEDSDDEGRLENYLELYPEERPDPEIIDTEIESLIDEIESTDPDEEQVIFLFKLLYTPSAPLRLRLLPIYLEERTKLLIQEYPDLNELRIKLTKSPDSKWLKRLADDPNAELADKDLEKLCRHISRIVTSLVNFAKEVDEGDDEGRLYPRINTELEAWEERIKDALSPRPKPEPTPQIPPLPMARQTLVSLSATGEDFHFEYRPVLDAIPEDKRRDFLRDLVEHRHLASNPYFFKHVIRQVDRSDMPTTEATEATRRWLDTYQDAREDRQATMSALIGLYLDLRRTELRRLIRGRASDLLA